MFKKDIIYWMLLTTLFLLVRAKFGTAQDTLLAPQPVKDTGQIIHLLNADKLLGIQGTEQDSTQMQKLIGNVRLKQGGTIFTSDSAIRYLSQNTINAYGHIHINQADTINTYADFLHYEGNTRIATLKRNVKMSDGHMVLTTDHLTYDMKNHVGSYNNGGKLVNQETVLTSQRGDYYTDNKDVYFKYDVKLNNPEYTLTTDTLLYNTISHVATFLAPTAINTGATIIYTSCGTYNTDEQTSHLCNRPTIVDSSGILTADTLDLNKTEGIGKAYGRVVWTDSSGQAVVQSNYAVSHNQKKTILATKEPMLILSQKKDTLFVTSDTLFSGPAFPKDTTQMQESEPGPDSLSYVYINPNSPIVQNYKDSLGIASDSMVLHSDTISQTANTLSFIYPEYKDTVIIPSYVPEIPLRLIKSDPTEEILTKEQLPEINDTLLAKDTLAASEKVTEQDSSQMRNVIAYHRVRLYSDSLQGIADSLYYSDIDSAFRFYIEPVLWTGQTQLTGDTIVLFTKDQQASKLVLQNNAMIVNKVGPNQYNQIKGNIITGYFNDSSQLKWMKVQGNAECIYYAQEDNGAFVGVNHTTSSSIRLYFNKNQLNKVVFVKDADGTFSNPLGLTTEETQLEGFKWEGKKRPPAKPKLSIIKNRINDTRERGNAQIENH